MKIITYNLLKDSDYREHWSQVIQAFDPDIFLAQESHTPHECGLPHHFNGQRVWRAVNNYSWGTAVYAKCGKITELDLAKLQGSLVGIEVEGLPHPGLSDRHLRVFSLHAPTGNGWASTIKAINEILDVIARIGEDRGDADTIIGGDFNVYSLGQRHQSESKDGKPWLTREEERAILTRLRGSFGLINCWQTLHPDVPLAQTLRWRRKPAHAFHCDGIFVPVSWSSTLHSCEVISPETWASRGNGLPLPQSDHNPVLATFR